MAFIDRSATYSERMRSACEQALNKIGIQAESHAKQILTEGLPRNASGTSTGALRNSIAHTVKMNDQSAYIGTNVGYAIYNEYGTGVYADGGGGKNGYWVYVPGGSGKTGTAKVYSEQKAKQIVAILRSKGIDAHMTKGMKPLHFLKRAVEEHKDEYIKMTRESINKAF